MSKFRLTCIIDDDPVYVFYTKKLLNFIGFSDEVLVFENGRDALEFLKISFIQGIALPEIILLDINMPIMNGWQFLDAFYQIPLVSKPKIYIVSSSWDSSDVIKAESYLDIDYIVKPISKSKMEAIMTDNK